MQAAIDVTGGTKTKWGEQEIDWSGANWRRMTMREAIIHYWPESRGGKAESCGFCVTRFGEGAGAAIQLPATPTSRTIRMSQREEPSRVYSKQSPKST